MWLLRRVCAFVALLCFCPSIVSAASIYVSVTAPDPVGKVLAYELRERIASSARNKLVIDPEDAAFKVMVVTLDPGHEGTQTIYSVVLNFNNYSEGDNWDYYITSWVGVCGKTVISTCARNLAGNIDGEIQPVVEELARILREVPDKKRQDAF